MTVFERVIVAYLVAAAAFMFVVGVIVSVQGYPAVWVIAAPIASVLAWGAWSVITE